MKIFKIIFVLLFFSFLFLPQAFAAPSAPVLKWKEGGCYNSWCETGWYSSPAVSDLDGDGKQEVVASAYSIVALDGKTGDLIWRNKSGHDRNQPDAENVGRTWSKVFVEDIDADSKPEIITAHHKGTVSVYDHNGYFQSGWPKKPISQELRGLVVDDLDGDSTSEIIVTGATGTDENTWVYEHDGVLRSGWPQLGNDSGYSHGVFNNNASVGDLDGDGDKEIVVPSDVHYICAYNPDGTQLSAHSMYNGKGWGKVGIWEDIEVENRGWGHCDGNRKESFRTNFANGASVISDVDGDGSLEVIATGSVYDCSTGNYQTQYIGPYIFNADRSRYNKNGYDWSSAPRDTGGPISTDWNTIESVQYNPVVVDLDGDNEKEILYASYDGRMHAFWLDKTEHGSWPFSVYQSSEGVKRFASEPVVLDFENDGFAEVIFTSWVQKGSHKTGRLHVLNHQGTPLHQVDLPMAKNGDWNGGLPAPTLGNIDNDADLELVINTAHSGVIAYDLPGTANARILWETGRNGKTETMQMQNALPASSGASYSFPDISYYKYRDSVQSLKDQGVIQGYSDGKYKPNNTINRAEFLKIVLEASEVNLSDGSYANCFPDVQSQWFSKYVCYAKSKGYIKGYPNGFYRPSQNVNYVEALKILYEVNGDAGKTSSVGNKWYSPYLEDAQQFGITLAELTGRFSHFLTRGEMAEIMVRYLAK